jgi:hypothetical protein
VEGVIIRAGGERQENHGAKKGVETSFFLNRIRWDEVVTAIPC